MTIGPAAKRGAPGDQHGRPRTQITAARRVFVVLALLVASTLVGVAQLHAGGDWNDGQIVWQPYDKGLASAKEQKKPICLVVYTEWCPHCANYSEVFHDPKVVARAKQFVMIRVDKDKNAEVSKRYAPDGEYIPRTYFLSWAATLDPEIHAPREQYKYFYSETDPASVLAGMDAAAEKLK